LDNKVKEFFVSLFTSRVWFLLILAIVGMSALIYRVFELQIVHGEEYVNSFQAKTKRERTVVASRGNIYDRNGELLAYNELAYSVKIEDVYESGKSKNSKLNNTIYKTILILENNGDKLDSSFNIYVDEYNNYQFSVSGTSLNRFRADVYGCSYIDDMTYAQSSSTADEIMEYLTGGSRFSVDIEGIDKEMILKITSVRYSMSFNSYQKYIATTIATNVSEKTVAVLYENSDILKGVTVSEDTIRVYPKGVFTSQIIGYTGKISSDELTEYKVNNDTYTMSDIVGKTGIEKSMEAELRGTNGTEKVFVDTLGKVVSVDDYVEPVAGNDVYLSIDSGLQEAVYHILEQKLAGILLKKIFNGKEYVPAENASSSSIMIPIYDVYYQLFNNNVIDVNHLSADDATDNEKAVYEAFVSKKSKVMERLYSELTDKATPYKKLTTEYKNYENYIEKYLINKGILMSDKIDTSDETYIAWAIDETISLEEYLKYCISKSWIDNDYLQLDGLYSESSEIYESIISSVMKKLDEDASFDKLIYRYLVKDDLVKPRTICNVLLDQGIVSLSDDEAKLWEKKSLSPYNFMINRITNLEITPAQLALDPYSASMVITDVKTGQVLALVSYPSYDNNMLANGADADYLKKVNSDLSLPLINYATQQRTAPGSTYKMVSAAAGLSEGVVTVNSLITCVGSFEEISDTHNCWIYPGRHNALNVTNAIKSSCNYYFYTVGYRLSLDENNKYNSNLGIEKLNEYASMFGLEEKSGVEIEEYSPILSNAYSVPSAIGQGTNSFTTVGLARYVTAVANSGTVYNLTLLDKLADREGNVLKEYEAEVINQVDLKQEYWDAIHEGMRRVVKEKSYFQSLNLDFAGKTGTAQQSRTRADHGLFVCYAPYDDPEIAIAVRIANGYTSEYVADTTKDVLKWYFGIEEEEDIVTGTASDIEVTRVSGD